MRFVNIGNCRRNKEDGDVDPIGRFSDSTVIGVKKNGYQYQSDQNSPKLYAPEIFLLPKEEALYDRVEEGWPEEQLHVLPGGLVYTGKRCCQ